MNCVLDTNVIIYAQKGALAAPLPHGRYFVSVITEIELLSFPDLTPEHEQVLIDFLGDLSIVGIDTELKRRNVELRRRYRLRIPDAIIAATALAVEAELLTNDVALAQVADLRCRTVDVKQR